MHVPRATTAAATAVAFVVAAVGVVAHPCDQLVASNNYVYGASLTAAIVTGADVLGCYGSFTTTSSVMTSQVATLKKYFNLYPYLDIIKSSSSPYFTSNLDLFATLDAIASNPSITTEYDFQTQVQAAIASLNDAHSSYQSNCFLAAEIFQPFVIDAKYAAGSKPTIYIRASNADRTDLIANPSTSSSLSTLMGSAWANTTNGNPSQYIGYTVSKINGLDAVDYIQKFADYWSSFSHTPEARFNLFMPSAAWDSHTSSYVLNDGSLYRMVTIPYNLDWYWDYELVSPAGQAVTLSKVPWAGFADTNSVISSGSYYYNDFCSLQSGKKAATAAKTARKMHVPTTRLPVGLKLNASQALLAHETQFAAATSRLATKEGAAFSLSKPLVSDEKDAFYLLDDGVTGVWVLSSFEPADLTATASFESFLGTITGGLRALESAGASKLVIDLSHNGGGVICIGNFILGYLMSSPSMPTYDIRLSDSFSSLIQYADSSATKNYDTLFSEVDFVPSSGGSILTGTQSFTRGGVSSTYSQKFYLNCTDISSLTKSMTPLSKGWSPNAISIVADGYCGSTCAEFTRVMRDEYGVKAYVTGGGSGATYQPSSFEGGSVCPFDKIQAEAADIEQYTSVSTSTAATWPISSFLLPVHGTLPLWESYSAKGSGGLTTPEEWVPEPADAYIDVANIFDKAAVWAAAATLAGSQSNTGKSSGPSQTTSGSGAPRTAGKPAAPAGLAVAAVLGLFAC
ncbi:hypothetical protein HK405_011822, partial [Cladochytrium tenue]